MMGLALSGMIGPVAGDVGVVGDSGVAVGASGAGGAGGVCVAAVAQADRTMLGSSIQASLGQGRAIGIKVGIVGLHTQVIRRGE